MFFCRRIFMLLGCCLIKKLVIGSSLSCGPEDVSFRGETNENNGNMLFIEGEMIEVDCTLNTNLTSVNVSLLQKNFEHTWTIKRPVDGQKIKMLQHNIFLIPYLEKSDAGRYYCNACNNEAFIRGISVETGVPFAKPTIVRKPDRDKIPSGQTIIIDCLINGSLINDMGYEIEWFHSKRNGKNVTLRTKQKNRVVIAEFTHEDQGTYTCKISRPVVSYFADTSTSFFLQVIPPRCYEFYGLQNVVLMQNKIITFRYNVSSQPEPNITWFRVKEKNTTIEVLAFCPTAEKCDTSLSITRDVFTLIAKYPEDNNSTFLMVAENMFGKLSRSFHMIVHAVPVLQKPESLVVYHTNMQLNCTIKEANPMITKFTWEMCDTGACDNQRSVWKYLSHEPNIIVRDQVKPRVWYRCSVKNAIGNDTALFEVVSMLQESKLKESVGARQAVLIAFGILTVVGLTFLFIWLFKRKKHYGGFYLFSFPPQPDYIERLDHTKDYHAQVQKLPIMTEWEFPRERITLVSELGMGEFGCVWLAHAIGISEFRPRKMISRKESQLRISTFFRGFKPNSYVLCKKITKVAVKQLKENWDKSKYQDLQTELRILIHVGEHQNIVNVLGACTKGKCSELSIIMEYCPYGNLRTFLRDRRDIYHADEQLFTLDYFEKLGPKNLILLAKQVANGMEFLTNRKIVHRDLAARNILIGERFIAKIADFGLARNVYNYEHYLRKSSGLVPLKWMAIESIKSSVFTQKTDVWSFGILLWEIFTLGGTPYPGIPASELYDYLLRGERMEYPMYCPEEISQLMERCWQEKPDNRPTFEELVKIFNLCTVFDEHEREPIPDELEESEVNKSENKRCLLLQSQGPNYIT